MFGKKAKLPEWGIALNCGNATTIRQATKPSVGDRHRCNWTAHPRREEPCVIIRVKSAAERPPLPPIY